MNTTLSVTLKVIKALEECGINYLIGGSLGSSIYGIPRATLDADLVSDIKETQVSCLVEKLKNEFYIDKDMINEAIKNKSCFNVIHLETMFKVDIFILKTDSPYGREEFARKRLETISNDQIKANVASPEDIILTKLLWYKDGGLVSERQWKDAKGVFKVQGSFLDQDYLNKWACRLGIRDLLDKLKQEE